MYKNQKMYKNQLQELAQRSCFNLPFYACVREGPDHAPRFKASVNFNGETFQCPFYCTTIRQAEHAAAQAALASLSSTCPSKSLTARVLDESGIYKNLLQETAHRAGMKLPMYSTVRSGPSHIPIFTSTVDIGGNTFKGDSANTKKQAEKNAAIAAWSVLKTMPNLGSSSSQSSKIPKTREHLDQAIVTSALSNLRRPVDESKLHKRGDLNQTSSSMFIARGHKYTDITTNTKPLSSCLLKGLMPIPKPPTIQICKSTIKIQEVSPSRDNHRRDANEWLGRNSKGETTTFLKNNNNTGNSRLSGSSSYCPIKLLGHWSYGEVAHGGYNPRKLKSIAPAVQVRSVVPVCATPPLLQRTPTTSSYLHTQPLRNAISKPYSDQLSSSMFNEKLHLGRD